MTTSFQTKATGIKIMMKLITLLLVIGTMPAFTQSLDLNILSVKNPVINLNGVWKINTKPNEYSLTDKEFSKWQDIRVPGELAMQGFRIDFDKPVIYKKEITLPPDFKGQKIILRFDGVYSYSRLWINDNFICEHHGGFTRWENDITKWVTPGKPDVITLEVTDMKDDISCASLYAHHAIGGILRDVTLYAVPQNNITGFVLETDLDNEYNNATLKLAFTSFQKQNASVLLTLTDPQGNIIPLSNNKADLVSGENQKIVSNSVSKPLKWDAEHPDLYTLKVELSAGGKKVYSFSERFGFRKIEILKTVMLLNGKPVKLRGACRHDVNPKLGRVSTDEYDKLDVLLAKEANMNFIRTSHYPPSERFLKYCDEYGIFVESESAVCFAQDPPEKVTTNLVKYEQRYLSQFKEMVNTLRNHSSVIMWSLGNESYYGPNIQKCYDWIKQEDTTRPVIFSYPGTVPSGTKCYDILSVHYPGLDGNMFNQHGISMHGFSYESMPVIFDEWTHVPCYTNETLRNDPNIREFWGQSLDMMWNNIFEINGGLGGSIWGFIDESFMLPRIREDKPTNIESSDSRDTCLGYGEWGIVDVWRRHKPEFWATKKAYSPIKVLQTEIKSFVSGSELFIPIYNRFNNTNRKEIDINFIYLDRKIKIESPDIKSHAKGLLAIPANDWKSGQYFNLEFLDKKSGKMIDLEKISLSQNSVTGSFNRATTGSLNVEEKGSQIIVKGENFTIPVDKTTGMIENAVLNGNIIIRRGPYLNASVLQKNKIVNLVQDSLWRTEKVSYRKQDNKIVIEIKGSYSKAECRIILQIDPVANISVDFMYMGNGIGSSHELGLTFALNSDIFEALQWDRKSYWSIYPENHLGGPVGNTPLYSLLTPVLFGQNPDRDWSLYDKNFYYFGLKGSDVQKPLVNQVKALKENIKEYSVLSKSKNAQITVTSDDYSLACRLFKPSDKELMLNIDTYWDYPEISWGNYSKNKKFEPFTGRINLQLK